VNDEALAHWGAVTPKEKKKSKNKPRTIGKKAGYVPEPVSVLSLPLDGTEAPVFLSADSQSTVRTIVRNKGMKKCK